MHISVIDCACINCIQILLFQPFLVQFQLCFLFCKHILQLTNKYKQFTKTKQKVLPFLMKWSGIETPQQKLKTIKMHFHAKEHAHNPRNLISVSLRRNYSFIDCHWCSCQLTSQIIVVLCGLVETFISASDRYKSKGNILLSA